ncbi:MULTISPECIES: photosystem II reaction center protein Psb28 [unclassified Leptolyngbya]|uniref:photosystem II reaction center protein Psb28 n=1 Tax=unclassified Leptolyngbya TaxID=2650499 RepID=UPI001685F99A|nr:MULTISPECIES: photosystem II reaction center protein Psb28 [unclassified Leptolyngbya]MBD1910752.1 photosystem II reaction center protein Psb28 [Leptolyngbya sp. FACHB-8]MBD2158229.1 photosystem II reaction center protein Psb28 [Leptolyngbya sp. FACHB-16]
MAFSTPSIEFFDGLPETLSDVSLRRDRNTGTHILVLSFEQLQALERFNSFTRQFNQSVRLTDEEGNISLTPSSLQVVYGGSEGDDLQRVECRIEIDQEEHWERLMRFLYRYAEANGLEYGEPGN